MPQCLSSVVSASLRSPGAENVFIAHQNHPHTGKDHLHVKIGDLGLVARQEDDASTKGFAGTPGYIAPELYQYWNDDVEEYDERCDIWSIGMILADLLLPVPFAKCGGGSAAFQVRAVCTCRGYLPWDVACCRLLRQVLLDTEGVDANDEEDEGDASKVFLRLGAKEPLRAIIETVQVRAFRAAQAACHRV